jgi:hypothetical protein
MASHGLGYFFGVAFQACNVAAESHTDLAILIKSIPNFVLHDDSPR